MYELWDILNMYSEHTSLVGGRGPIISSSSSSSSSLWVAVCVDNMHDYQCVYTVVVTIQIKY